MPPGPGAPGAGCPASSSATPPGEPKVGEARSSGQSSREEQRSLLARGAAASPAVPDIRVEEEGQLPLPVEALHYLLPRYLILRGSGDPKGVWLKSLSSGFLVWWRAWGPYTEGHVNAVLALPFWDQRVQRYYRNPWTDFDQMRRCCEQCPGVEVWVVHSWDMPYLGLQTSV